MFFERKKNKKQPQAAARKRADPSAGKDVRKKSGRIQSIRLTRSQKKEIEAVYARARGDGKVHTAQDTIPYERVWKDGLMKTTDGRYSKTILFEDINYQLASPNDQENAFSKFCEFYNFFDSSVQLQITLMSHFANKTEWVRSIDIPYQDDEFNDVREEYTQMLREKLSYGNNGLEKTKLLTISLEAANEKEARNRLGRLELDTISHLKAMGVVTTVLNGRQRLLVLFNIFHPDGEAFYFDWKYLPASGLSTKDFIVPSSFSFRKSREFTMGEKLCRVSCLQIASPEMTDRILADFMDAEEGIVINLHIKSIDQVKAIKMIKHKITDIDAMKIQEQKKASRDGYDRDIIPSDINAYGGDAKNLLSELMDKNEKMFLLTFLIMSLGNDEKTLKDAVARAVGIAEQYNCKLMSLDFMQEPGLISSLPLGMNRIPIERTLTTSSTAIFVPFTSQEIFQGGEALYYGLNAISGNMILADRKKLKTPNGLIIGTPGSGKSFAAKREIANAFLITKDDIVICDPEGEYSPLTEQLHGQVIKVSSNSRHYINPMDISMDYAEEDNPLDLKLDFIFSFCETIMGYPLDGGEKTIIKKASERIYQPYLEDPVPSNMPILTDLHRAIKDQGGLIAEKLANSIELYLTGSFSIFNHQTNVDIKNRLVCFDIRDLGKHLKQLGMLIIQDQIWNRVTANRTAGKFTRYYIDEFHLLLKGEIATWSVNIWKRFRKWGGIPTGITQNIKDFLSSPEISNIFENSEFIYMLNQAPGDREILASKLSISPEQLKYVTNSEAGEGLIFYGNVILPFVDHFPKDTKLYKIMSTKPNELAGTDKGSKVKKDG